MRTSSLGVFLASVLISAAASATPVINEIMFHPPGLPEDTAKEWIEIYNDSQTATIDLSGWKLRQAVEFTFSAGTALPPGGFLIVAADLAVFQANHPTVTNAVGGWTGQLSNSGEVIRLENVAGQASDEVAYARDGDWGVRARGPLDHGHQGWIWAAESDGGGKSLELRTPSLAGFDSGQNWSPSAVAGGTPGAVNSVASSNVAPLILAVNQRPRIPRSTDPVRVSAKIADEGTNASAVLRWRVDGANTFNAVAMTDSDADGQVDATIPPQGNGTIVEFYVEATDGTASRTWPAPARISAPGVAPEVFAQATNLLFQVDDLYDSTALWTPGSQPVYRVILTAAERAELQQIWTTSSEDQSAAAMNATLIGVDGTGEELHYLCSVRNRGNGTTLGPPNNSLISFRSDDLWRGRQDLALNSRYPHSQVLGALLLERMGLAVQETAPVQVRYNGQNLAQSDAVMFGSYARAEHLGLDWLIHHFPLDAEGNLYEVRDTLDLNGGGNLRYEGTDPNSYSDSYFKQTNQDANDYSDLINLTDKLNNAPAAGYRQAINQVADVDQWLLFLAANSLIGNSGGISTGRGNDYSLYRGVADTRFKFLPNDLDATMGFGSGTPDPNRSIFNGYDQLPGLSRMLQDPDILPDYYAKFLDLISGVFNPTAANPLIEQAIGYTPQSARDAAKNFVIDRRNGVLAQIQQNYAFAVTGNAADVEGMKQTTDGSALFSGTFNVAKTRSILVNGQPATLYYRTQGVNGAGTWNLTVAAGSGFLNRGINRMTANFYAGPNGSGTLLKSATANVYYSGGTLTGLSAGGVPTGGVPSTNLIWTQAASPFHITTDVTIPAGTTLTIEPGVTVLADENKHILVNGHVHVVGDANHHITMSGVPGQALKADPADAGLPRTTPKWGGLWIETSPNADNIVSYVDFVDAQDALSGGNATSRGCIEVKNSEALIDHCTFRGSHLHVIYGDHCSITIQYCDIPDEFPGTDLPGALNNVAEPVKMINKFLPGGHAIVRWNTFHGNKGHNDVLDVDSDVVPNPILQVRENIFLGQSGDEDCDLGGDVFIDGNFFAHGHKDNFNTSAGYASAFTTGDAGTGTTIVASRNILWDVDHATALKTGTGAIFEHNTCFSLHPNFVDGNGKTNVASVITFVVPAEGTSPGDGAYTGNNIFWTIPQIFGDADRGTNGTGTFPTRLQFDYNLVDPATPTAVGSLHPGGLFSLGSGNLTGNPKLVDPTNGNFALAPDSPAKGATIFGKDLGALVPGGAWITGEPLAQTASTSATLTVGGPGIFYYKWKLDGGAWSAAIAIDPANPLRFPRNGPTKRTAQLQLSALSNGPHTVSVAGQDFAGVWQDDAAATVSKTWSVDTGLQLIRLNEILADSATVEDTIELYNGGASDVDLGGYALSSDSGLPAKYVIPANTIIAAGGYRTFASASSGIDVDKAGDRVLLYNGATVVDAVTFGPQITGFTIGRVGQEGLWTLCTPTLGAQNIAQQLGDPGAVRINEWFTSGKVLYDSDWIELANGSQLPVALAGLRLTDNAAGNPTAQPIVPLSFIAANGFLKLIADGKPEVNGTHLAFSLDAEQDQIALFNGTTLLDQVFFFPQTTDYSMGRDNSSPTGYTFYELPTAGLANGTGDPAYANALALLRGLRITEIMFNPIGGVDYQFIELRNVGATPLQLGGVRLVQGIAFAFPPMTLAPGQNVVLVADLAKFQSRYGTGVNVGGAFTGRLDSSGETVALQLPSPFDANILTFNYSDRWQPSANGLGKSLVIGNPLARASLWGDSGTWVASASNGGDPDGVTIAAPDHFPAWLTYYGLTDAQSDTDRDGISALLEYALGMNPTRSADLDGAARLPRAAVAADGHLELQFELLENLGAAQLHGPIDLIYTVEASNDLTTWAVIATKNFSAGWSAPATVTLGNSVGGFVPVTVLDTAGTDRRFLRLRASLVP